MHILTAAALAAVTLAAAPACAAPIPQPRTAAEVPLYPGLVKTGQEAVAADSEVLMDWNDPIPFVAGTRVLYTVAATPEEVHAFYLGKLGGKIEYGSEDGHETIKPGGSTPVILSFHPHDFGPGMAPNGDEMPGSRKKALLVRSRKALASGEWVNESQFQWIIKDAKGDLRSFQVDVQDDGLAKDWSSWRPNTTVAIRVSQFRH